MVDYKSLDFLGFPDYKVGTDGSIWSRKISGSGKKIGVWKRMNPSKDSDGYLVVDLYCLKQRKMFKVHRLVLLAFVGECPKGMTARHFPDRTPTNCSLSNLSWGTPSQNQDDKIIHNTHQRGQRCWKATITEDKVREAREKLDKGWTIKETAKYLGVGTGCIYHIKHRRSWAYL